jgi:hypothetical protein
VVAALRDGRPGVETARTGLQTQAAQGVCYVRAVHGQLAVSPAVQHVGRLLAGPHDSRAVGVPPCMAARAWDRRANGTHRLCHAAGPPRTCQRALSNVESRSRQPANAVWVWVQL